MKGCYDGDECIQWHICARGHCKVREQVELLRSRSHEDAPTQDQSRNYTGETTEVLGEITEGKGQLFPGELEEGQIIRLQASGTIEPEQATLDFTVFRPRDDLSLSEEEVAALRDRFLQANNRVAELYIPSLPPQVQVQCEYTRIYEKHRCLLCWLVSKLPGHHRCPHGRLVCEQCELEAGGW